MTSRDQFLATLGRYGYSVEITHGWSYARKLRPAEVEKLQRKPGELLFDRKGQGEDDWYKLQTTEITGKCKRWVISGATVVEEEFEIDATFIEHSGAFWIATFADTMVGLLSVTRGESSARQRKRVAKNLVEDEARWAEMLIGCTGEKRDACKAKLDEARARLASFKKLVA